MTESVNCQDGFVSSSLDHTAKTQQPEIRMVFDREIVVNKFQFISFYLLADTICPERLVEIADRYPTVPLNWPEPAHEVFEGILNAVNQLLLEETKKNEQFQSAFQKHQEEVAALKERIRFREEEVSYLQEQVDDLKEKLHFRRESSGRRPSTADFPGLTGEDSQDPSPCFPDSESDRSAVNSLERSDPPGLPEEPKPWEPASRMEAAEDGPIESQPMEDPVRERNSWSDGELPEGAMTTVEWVENSMTLGMAFEEWHRLDRGFSAEERQRVVSVLKIVGSGTVSKADILENLKGMIDPQLKPQSVARYLREMVEKYSLLKGRKYLIKEKHSLGRRERAYDLTILGKAAYRSISGLIEETPKDIEMIAIHKTPDHCEFVDRATKGFSHLGFDVYWKFEAPVWHGVKLTADLMVNSQERGQYYVFTLTHGQLKANKLTAKLNLATQSTGQIIYILTRKQVEAENEGWKAICYWAWNTHHDKDLTVYLLGLDTLEQLALSKAGSRIDPWFLQKTLRVSEHSNPFA
jgi:hypothetical protein